MNYENTFPYADTFNYPNYSKLFDKIQAYDSKGALTRQERAKKTLTTREKLVKWVQVGGILKYKDIVFYEKDGWNYLHLPNKTKELNTTLTDFLQAIDRFYPHNTDRKIKICRPL